MIGRTLRILDTATVQLARLVPWVFVAVVLIGGGIWITQPPPSIETLRSLAEAVATLETGMLAVSFAGITVLSRLLEEQRERLNDSRLQWLERLRDANTDALTEALEIYNKKFTESGSLPRSYRFQPIHHLSDNDIRRYLSALITYSAQLRGEGKASSVTVVFDKDPVLLFRVSCAVLLSDVCTARRADDPLGNLALSLKQLERRNGIVATIRNIYDNRRAARRGLPIFLFLILIALIATLTSMSLLDFVENKRLLLNTILLPVGPLLVFSGYYINELMRRYFQDR